MYIFSKAFDRSMALDENNMKLKSGHRLKKRPRLEERRKTTESKLGEKKNEIKNEMGQALEMVSRLPTKQVGNVYIVVPFNYENSIKNHEKS